MIAGNQQFDEFRVELVPAHENVVALMKLSCEPLVVYRTQIYGANAIACVSAWNKDPVSGVIGIQKGPL